MKKSAPSLRVCSQELCENIGFFLFQQSSNLFLFLIRLMILFWLVCFLQYLTRSRLIHASSHWSACQPLILQLKLLRLTLAVHCYYRLIIDFHCSLSILHLECLNFRSPEFVLELIKTIPRPVIIQEKHTNVPFVSFD